MSLLPLLAAASFATVRALVRFSVRLCIVPIGRAQNPSLLGARTKMERIFVMISFCIHTHPSSRLKFLFGRHSECNGGVSSLALSLFHFLFVERPLVPLMLPLSLSHLSCSTILSIHADGCVSALCSYLGNGEVEVFAMRHPHALFALHEVVTTKAKGRGKRVVSKVDAHVGKGME